MRLSVYLTYCSLLLAGILWAYSGFVDHFNRGSDLKLKISILEDQLNKRELQAELATYQIEDLRQTLLGIDKNQIKKNDPLLASLSSTLRAPASISPLDLSPVLFEKGKRLFQQGKYAAAKREFSKLQSQYPLSRYLVESYFFQTEAAFQEKDYKATLTGIEEMTNHFPDHLLTGYILLRMGQISEINHQDDEARETYQIVIDNFSDANLIKQAKALLDRMDKQ